MAKAAEKAEKDEGPPCKTSLGVPSVSPEDVENTPHVAATAANLQAGEKPAAEAAEEEAAPRLQHDSAEQGASQERTKATAASQASENGGVLRDGGAPEGRRRHHQGGAAGESSDEEPEAAAATAATAAKAEHFYLERGRGKRFRGGGLLRRSRSNSLLHPRSRFSGGPLNFALLAEKHPPLSAFLSVSPSGYVSYDFSSREAQLQLCTALFRCIYSLSFSLPPSQSFLVPTLPNRSNYIHFLADLLSHTEGLGPPRGPPIPGGDPYILKEGAPRGESAAAHSQSAPDACCNGAPSLQPATGAVGEEGEGGPPRGPQVRVLDVGVGASCVYPLLGVADYDWCFVGSDINGEFLSAAAANVKANALGARISLRQQEEKNHIFQGVVRESDPLFAASVCNPPFYASEEEVAINPRREKGGSTNELVCEGGEEAFLARMLSESKSFCCNFLWFTTLVARATTRDRLKREIHAGMRKAGKQQESLFQGIAERWLTAPSQDVSTNDSGGSTTGVCIEGNEREVHPRELRVFELSQGKQTRWVVCWTYWTKGQRQLLRQTFSATMLEKIMRRGPSALGSSQGKRPRNSGTEMQKATSLASLLILCADPHARTYVNAIPLKTPMPGLPIDLIYDRVNHKFKLLPDPEEMAERLTDGSLEQKKVFLQLYNSAMKDFDLKGYNWLLDTVMDEHASHRFLQTLEKVDNENPHCNPGQTGGPAAEPSKTPFPGGPFRSLFGFDLTRWLTELVAKVQSAAGTQAPGLSLVAVMSLMMVKGLVQSVASTVMDVAPPAIPPPVWINQPLPCLPMLTGRNCFGSILYPITMPDFLSADVTDSVMEGVIGSFPSKYQNKVGKTSETQYRICATAYLGMYCASIFPHCWNPSGMMKAMAQPLCFPHCIATLIACPGFWLDDIMGPCSDISIPPFCSFGLFLNHKRIPPLYTTFAEDHPFPRECPKFDPLYDIPDDLFVPREPIPTPFVEETPPEIPYTPLPKPPVYKPPMHVEKCNCLDLQHLRDVCLYHAAVPVVIAGNSTTAPTHFQVPSTEMPNECCVRCKAYIAGPLPQQPVETPRHGVLLEDIRKQQEQQQASPKVSVFCRMPPDANPRP
ncbi:hypothetical protein Esti_004670 [Eimeria stiedai]